MEVSKGKKRGIVSMPALSAHAQPEALHLLKHLRVDRAFWRVPDKRTVRNMWCDKRFIQFKEDIGMRIVIEILKDMSNNFVRF